MGGRRGECDIKTPSPTPHLKTLARLPAMGSGPPRNPSAQTGAHNPILGQQNKALHALSSLEEQLGSASGARWAGVKGAVVNSVTSLVCVGSMSSTPSKEGPMGWPSTETSVLSD